jgi:hypothetical protein
MSIRINDLTVRFKNGVVAVNKASLEEWCRKNHFDEGSYNCFKTNGRNGFP